MEEFGTIVWLLVLIAPWIWKMYRERARDEKALGPGAFTRSDPNDPEPIEPK